MNIFTSALNPPRRVIDLENGKPLSLHLPVGSAVRAVLGTLWITQEGLLDDIILRPGERYEIRRKGQLVIGAIDGDALAYLAAPGEAVSPALAVEPQVVDALTARAARLRRRETVRLARLAAAVIMQAARRLRTLWRKRRRFAGSVNQLPQS